MQQLTAKVFEPVGGNPGVMRGTTSVRIWRSTHTSERPFSRLWMFDGMTVNNDHLNRDDHKESAATISAL